MSSEVEEALEEARACATGYDMIRRFLTTRPLDPWAIVEAEWSNIDQSNALGRSIADSVPGLDFVPESPLRVAALLLTALHDYFEAAEYLIDDPDSIWGLLGERANDWAEKLQRLEARQDEFDEAGDEFN